MRRVLLAYALLATPYALAQTRIASDFEIEQMERQLARSHDFISQLSGHLNLGDLRATRNESAHARTEYETALQIASSERLTARRASDLTRYATATSYAALAQAKLGKAADSFGLAEEAIRYSSDSATSWNLYANTMSALAKPAKAVSAARNAVAIAGRDGNRLDLAVDQYSLASSLLDLHQSAEAERLLVEIVSELRSNDFDSLRREIARSESFEIYSSARGDAAAYISLLNRSQLRLARLYEDRGDLARAREQYANVLAGRSDDPTALGAMARLAQSPDDQERYFAQAFDANPFSLPLIRDYQGYLGERPAAGGQRESDSIGATMRLLLQQMQRGELAGAIVTITTIQKKFPGNDTLALLRREIEERRAGGSVLLRSTPSAADLRAIIAAFNENRLTPGQRARLDQMTFTGTAIFNAGPPFERGTIEDVPFRFGEPTAFNGTFTAGTPLRLTFRILGATQQNGADALLLEPLRLEAAR